MRLLIYLCLLLILTACSVPPQELPAPTQVSPATGATTPQTAIPGVALTSAPTMAQTHAATTAPTMTPTSPPSAAPTFAVTASATSAATRAPMSMRSAPVCTKMPAATTPAAGQLGSLQKPIVIALEVYGDAERTAVAGAELADCLSKITGLSYKVQVGATAATSLQALGAGHAQIAFLDTLSIIHGQAKYGFDTGLVILRTYQDQLAPFSQRQFIANTASGVRTLSDLHGKTFCFGEPNSPYGTGIPRIVLAANGINPDKDLRAIKYAGFAENIASAVYKGDCDAGTTYVDVLTFPGAALDKTFPDLHEKVQVFYVTDKIPNDGVQYVKNLDPKIKQATTEALLAMAADNPGKQPPLVHLYKIEGFMKADNQFYKEFANLVKKAGINPVSLVR